MKKAGNLSAFFNTLFFKMRKRERGSLIWYTSVTYDKLIIRCLRYNSHEKSLKVEGICEVLQKHIQIFLYLNIGESEMNNEFYYITIYLFRICLTCINM